MWAAQEGINIILYMVFEDTGWGGWRDSGRGGHSEAAVASLWARVHGAENYEESE